MPYALDDNSPAARHAQAAAGVNTLSAPAGRPQLLWPDGTPVSDADFEHIRQYGSALSDEDARRFDVGQGNAEANQRLAQQTHADQVAESKRAFQEGQRQFNLNYAQGQQNFGEGVRRFDVGTGADLLKYAGTLRGPLNFVQGDMVAQGINQGGLSPFIQSLRTGQPVQYGGGTATSGNPTPLTVGTLANTLMGGTGGAPPPTASGVGSVARPAATDAYGRPTLSPDVQAAVDAGSQTFTSGLANKPLGFLENQTQSQRDALSSIGGYLGRDVSADDEYYRRSRPGQGLATAA